MGVTSVLPLQAAGLREMMFLMMVFMAVLMAASIASAALFSTYRSRFSMANLDAGSSRGISNAPIETRGGGLSDSARAVLEVRRSTSEGRSFGEKETGGGNETKMARKPLRTVSNVERWKLVLSFVATVCLGAVMYGFGDVSFGSESVLVLAGLAVFFCGAVLLSGGFMSLRLYHIVRETPTTDAADVSVGETVEVYGTAKASDHGTHKAPFSHDDCLVCEYEVIEKSGKDEVVDSGTAGVPFYVDDGTGKVLVDPEDAKLKMPLDTEKEVESQKPPSELQGGYVDVGVNEVDSEYRERYLEPGKEVYVYGDAVGSDGEDVVVNRGREDSIFLIADSSEGELRKSLLPKAAAYGLTGIVLMSVGLGVAFWLSGLSTLFV